MGRLAGTMKQSGSGLTTPIYDGFSWPTFFFGAFWYLVKGMWGIGLLWIVLSIVTGTVLHWIGILVMPFLSNRHYREHLAARGYAMVDPSSP